MAFVKAASVLGMRTDPRTGVARETPIRDLRELFDAEMLVYAPCDELRTLVEQGCITPSITTTATRSPGTSPTSSPSRKRKGRVSSVTSNVERVHRYGAALAKMDVSPREKAQIEDLLIVGDAQVVDAMEQFVVHRNAASVRRVLRGPSSSPSAVTQPPPAPSLLRIHAPAPAPLDTLALDFSSLDVHSPAVPPGGSSHANPFFMATSSSSMDNPFVSAATSFHAVTEQSSGAIPSFHTAVTALDDPFGLMSPPPLPTHSLGSSRSRSRPSLMFSDDDLSSTTTASSSASTSALLPSIREKLTPPVASRLALSLDDLETPSFDEQAPTLFSIAHVLDGVPVQSDFAATYVVGAVLGSGKYSVVKRCTHRATKQAFAVKIIDKRQMMEIKFLKRELEIMYGLRHDGVAQLIALYESNDELYLVLELCRQELFEFIDRNGPLAEATARKLVKRLVATVAYLHDQCIVHRDIKPENILIHGDDVSDIKLSDFGIARKLDGTVTLTPHESLTDVAAALNDSGGVRNRLARAHTKCGTRDYVAPEVMSGKGYGTEADLWSVGVVTFVLVSGCAPVFLPTADGTRKVFFPEDDGVWSSVSPELKSFIESLLVRNPEERATAAEALDHAWLQRA